jgi:hypothetical protein
MDSARETALDSERKWKEWAASSRVGHVKNGYAEDDGSGSDERFR